MTDLRTVLGLRRLSAFFVNTRTYLGSVQHMVQHVTMTIEQPTTVTLSTCGVALVVFRLEACKDRMWRATPYVLYHACMDVRAGIVCYGLQPPLRSAVALRVHCVRAEHLFTAVFYADQRSLELPSCQVVPQRPQPRRAPLRPRRRSMIDGSEQQTYVTSSTSP
jgi:hypothetical protein